MGKVFDGCYYCRICFYCVYKEKDTGVEREYHFQPGVNIYCQVESFHLLNVPDEKLRVFECSSFEHL